MRAELWLKDFPQSWHSYGFSPVWVLWCEKRWLRLKHFPQSLHSRVSAQCEFCDGLNQVRSLAVRLPTFTAFIGPHSSMSSLMQNEMCSVWKISHIQDIHRVSLSVSSLVPNKPRAVNKRLSTLTTCVQFVSCMSSLMGNKVKEPAEGFSTLFTLMVLHQYESFDVLWGENFGWEDFFHIPYIHKVFSSMNKTVSEPD